MSQQKQMITISMKTAKIMFYKKDWKQALKKPLYNEEHGDLTNNENYTS